MVTWERVRGIRTHPVLFIIRAIRIIGSTSVWGGCVRASTCLSAGMGNVSYFILKPVAGDCVVLVNGKEVCHNFDSHLPFDADISDYVNRDADNELLVGVRHTKLFDKSHSVYMKMGATYPTGSNTDDLIGIWQDVYLFGVPEVRITDVFVQPWVDKNELVWRLP